MAKMGRTDWNCGQEAMLSITSRAWTYHDVAILGLLLLLTLAAQLSRVVCQLNLHPVKGSPRV